MSAGISEWISKFTKIPSIFIADIKSHRVPKFLVVAWMLALLCVWLYASVSCKIVAPIDWSILVLVAMLLGANIGLNFDGGVGSQKNNDTKDIPVNPDNKDEKEVTDQNKKEPPPGTPG
jgi:hypothetical protein